MGQFVTEGLRTLLKSRFGHDRFLPMQEQVIHNVLRGHNSIVLMPTGGGKSLCYQLPALCLEGLTLVVSPLIALMKDQVDALNRRGIPAGFINSAMAPDHSRRVAREARDGQLKLLYVAPERIAMPRFRQFLLGLNVGLIAIDEAHCISEWGHDFRPDYRNLQSLRADFPTLPTIALTATATERVRNDIAEVLLMNDAEHFTASFNRPNLTYTVRRKGSEFEDLVRLLADIQGGSAIVYRFSRKGTEDLALRLSERGIRALAYHAGLDNDVRRENQEKFLHDEVIVIVATIAFGMGIDKPNVRVVVHYDLPKTIEGYYQETGRAGRDGLPSECVLYYSYGDKRSQEYFIRQIEDEAQRRYATQKLDLMVRYAESRTCRRAFLLDYFGERWKDGNCSACDACVDKSELPAGWEAYDGTDIAQKILSAVIRTGERFGTEYIVSLLRGSRAQRVLQQGHDQLRVYGSAREIPKAELKESVHQLVDKGLLARRDGDDLPTLFVATLGRQFLANRESVTLARPSTQLDQGPQPQDTELFARLRALRNCIADDMGVPAYVVFGNAALEQMATRMPTDTAAMLRIKGVGSSKLAQYGPAFLAAVRDHVTTSQRTDAAHPSDSSTSADSTLTDAPQGPTNSGYQVCVENLLSRLADHPVKLAAKTPGWEHILRSKVEDILTALPNREAAVLRLRFGLGDGSVKSLGEIGTIFSTPGERVRQIEEKALSRLRQPSRFTEFEKLMDERGVNRNLT